jgi:hypothetical protein
MLVLSLRDLEPLKPSGKPIERRQYLNSRLDDPWIDLCLEKDHLVFDCVFLDVDVPRPRSAVAPSLQRYPRRFSVTIELQRGARVRYATSRSVVVRQFRLLYNSPITD